MSTIDLAKSFRPGEPVRVELGCGNKKQPGWIGVDSKPLPGVDVVADLELGLGFLPDACVDELFAHHVLEHVEGLEGLLAEIVRVLKPSGHARIDVPHFSNPYYYSDYTHRRFFGLYTLYHFVDEREQLRRRVPTFYSGLRLQVIEQRLHFRPGRGRAGLGCWLLNRLVNLNSRCQELYEGRFCWIFPCYELQITFRGAPRQRV